MKRVLAIFALMIAAGAVSVPLLGGMSWIDSMGLRGPERELRSRIDAYWQARLNDDLNGMADFIHPLQSGMYDPGMLDTVSYGLQNIRIDGETAVATIDVKVRLKHPMLSGWERDRSLEDHWVRYEGKWYRELDPEL